MSATLPKRDSCCLQKSIAKGAGQVRYERDLNPAPFGETFCLHLPLALTPARFFFLWKPFAKFSNGGKMKNWMSGATEV